MPRKKKMTPAVESEVVSETPTALETSATAEDLPAVEQRPETLVTVAATPQGEATIVPASDTQGSEVAASVGELPTIPHRPLWIQMVSLGRDNAGPKMRLGRSERFQQMVIQFDEKPTDDTRIQLGDAGWRWRPLESYWTKQLNFDNRAGDQLQAEKLFAEIAWHERRERGLPGTQPTASR